MLEEAGFPAISHTTISNEVCCFGVLQKKQLEQMRDTLFLNGKEIKGQKKRLPILFIEADGVVVKCRRAKQKNIELKMGVVYEGWEEIAGNRKLKNSQIMVGVLDGIDFWETFTAVLSKKYDLKNTLVIINGDGASWVLGHRERILSNAVIQLDRFHLMRDLRIAVGKGTANKLIKILNDGELKAFVDTLESMETFLLSDKKKRFTKNFVT